MVSKSDSDDIIKAVDTLKPLGSGFQVISLGTHKMIQSVPREMSTDTSTVLNLAGEKGYLSESDIISRLNWAEQRASNSIVSDIFAQCAY